VHFDSGIRVAMITDNQKLSVEFQSADIIEKEMSRSLHPRYIAIAREALRLGTTLGLVSFRDAPTETHTRQRRASRSLRRKARVGRHPCLARAHAIPLQVAARRTETRRPCAKSVLVLQTPRSNNEVTGANSPSSTTLLD